MLNVCTFTGRLVEDPELRSTKADSISVTSLRLAVRRDFARKGEPDSDFFDVVAWRATAEFICKYFQKGMMISVSGRLQNRQWTDKHDQKRVSAELVAEHAWFADSKPKDDGAPVAAVPAGGNGGFNPLDAMDEDGDLPF
jgi:single-strand DNA-binding protein